MRLPFALAAALVVVVSTAHAQYIAHDGRATLSVDSAAWRIGFAIDGLVLMQEQYSPRGSKSYVHLADNESGLNLSVFIGRTSGTDPRTVGEGGFNRMVAGMKAEPKDVAWTEEPGRALLSYTIPELRGMKVDQRHFHAHYVKDGYWIDVHVSKLFFEDGDQKSFDAIAASLGLVDKSTATRTLAGTMLSGWAMASQAYMQDDFAKAKTLYQVVLVSEREERTLSQSLWKVLVDNLGMSQAMTGDLEGALATFEYGAAADPTYPMFHYNIACTYAEMNDVEKAIPALKRAHALRENMVEGERFPNPEKDSSFKRFLDNEAFKAAIEEMKVAER